jgi:hypothetical protein
MRREESIRRHIANLQDVLVCPCDCAKSGLLAMLDCAKSKELITRDIIVLQWCLGDNDELGSVVEKIAASAAKARSEGQVRVART